jgi:nitrate reductase gamma subunit
MVLLVYFPFGKLMHGGGFVLSPTRNQRTDFKRRFVNPWDVPVQYSDRNLSTPEKYRQTLVQPKEGGGG